MKVPPIRRTGFVLSFKVGELIINQFIFCILLWKENYFKIREIIYCYIYDENLGKC